MKKTFEVQTWSGNLLKVFKTLEEAEEHKENICSSEQDFDDIYIIGKCKDGEEFAPDFSYEDRERC